MAGIVQKISYIVKQGCCEALAERICPGAVWKFVGPEMNVSVGKRCSSFCYAYGEIR